MPILGRCEGVVSSVLFSSSNFTSIARIRVRCAARRADDVAELHRGIVQVAVKQGGLGVRRVKLIADAEFLQDVARSLAVRIAWRRIVLSIVLGALVIPL